MAKKDKFVYSTDYLANIHAPAPVEEIVAQEIEDKPVVQASDEKGKIVSTEAKPKSKGGRPKKS